MTDDQNENAETEAADAEAAAEAEAATQAEPEAAEAEAATEAAPEAAEAPAAEAEEPAAGDGEQAAAEPTEAPGPKERRRRARAVKAAAIPAKPSRTPEERHAERVAERRRKNQVRQALRKRTREKSRSSEASRPAPPAREHERGSQKTRQGIVVSDRADKTITVRIDVARRHPRYEKVVRTSRTLHAHDETNDAHIGDTVTVRECRPLSRSKRWRLVEVVERAK